MLGGKKEAKENKCFYTFVKLLLVDAKGGFDYFYNNLNSMIEANDIGKEFFAMTQKLDEMLLLNLFKEENFLGSLVDAGLRSLEANPLTKKQFGTLVATLNSYLKTDVNFFEPKADFLRLTLDQIWFLSAIKEFKDLTRANRKFRTQMEFLSGLAGQYLLAKLKIGDTYTELQHWAGSPILLIEFLSKKPAKFLSQPLLPSFLLLVHFPLKKKPKENPPTSQNPVAQRICRQDKMPLSTHPLQIPANHQQQALQVSTEVASSLQRRAPPNLNAVL